MKPIFVFGSNLAGIHSAGAAACALKEHGAIWGCGQGIQGNSYGVPTKDHHIQTLPLSLIQKYVEEFLHFATQNPDRTFLVTRIGCGLAGYQDRDIAPFFKYAPSNCLLPEGW